MVFFCCSPSSRFPLTSGIDNFLGGVPWEYFLFIGSFTVNHTGCAGYQVKSAEYNSYNSYNSLNFVYFSDCISSFIRTLHGTWKQVWKN